MKKLILLVSAAINGLYNFEEASLYISVFAIISALVGLFSLVIYSFRAVTIRQNQFKNKLD